MNWGKARELFRFQSPSGPADGSGGAGDSSRPGPGLSRAAARNGELGELTSPRPISICLASGKGGTGKSILTASLANLLGARGRTLIVDADLGVGDAHILQDITPTRTFVDAVEGELSLREVVEPCGGQIDLLAAGSGVSRMAGLSSYELHMIAAGLEDLELDYRYLLVDSAAGVSTQTLTFAAASDVVLLVTTPVLTAMTDAYAFLKVLLARRPESVVLLLVNRAADEDEARRVAERLGEVSGRFLGRSPVYLGWLPEDPAVTRSANRRAPVVVDEPDAEVSRALRRLTVRMLEHVSGLHPRGLGRFLRRQSERDAHPA